MSEIGIVVKVTPEIHAQLKEACQQNKRSMAKVIVALIEGWLENGAPDPYLYGVPEEDPLPSQPQGLPEDRRTELLLLHSRDIRAHGVEIELLRRQVEALEKKSADATRLERELKQVQSEVSGLKEQLRFANKPQRGTSTINPFQSGS